MKNLVEEKIKPKCKLIGTDGNVFVLAGVVSRCLRSNKMYDEEKEMSSRLWECASYDEALQLFCEYVDIE